MALLVRRQRAWPRCCGALGGVARPAASGGRAIQCSARDQHQPAQERQPHRGRRHDLQGRRVPARQARQGRGVRAHASCGGPRTATSSTRPSARARSSAPCAPRRARCSSSTPTAPTRTSWTPSPTSRWRCREAGSPRRCAGPSPTTRSTCCSSTGSPATCSCRPRSCSRSPRPSRACAATPPRAAATSPPRSRPARRSTCRCSSTSATRVKVQTRTGEYMSRA